MNREPVIPVVLLGSGDVLAFAASELGKYIACMTGRPVKAESATEYEPAKPGALWVGLRSHFPGEGRQVENPELDDAVYIDVKEGQGIISGNHTRSVLLAVYRFLTEAGCRWVRPGRDGEYLPRIDLGKLYVRIDEAASFRHRGLCIEGAVSYEHVAGMIDWLPKVGFNSYFIQFREAYTFFERWYTHRHNPLKKGREFGVAEARQLVARLETEIKKRGLLYHAVGHGWTCEPFGIPGLSWDQRVAEVNPETERYLALVNGKRQIWMQIPLNTNLCYSQPEVRSTINTDIMGYIRRHPAVDYLHFWLADERDNQCECEECRQALPSDFYVNMLNELDELLAGEGITTRIVFLIYYDLLWPPASERLKNPDRFTLMFAPITRLYNESFGDFPVNGELQPYVRNRLAYPRSVRENLAYLAAWQKIFTGDGFDFDYHMMWAHYFDTGYYRLAKIIDEDVKSLHKIGLNGLISCQVQRAFMPTGLPLYVMARTLWNEELSFREVAADYFKAAFGPDGQAVEKLMEAMPELLGELNTWAPVLTPAIAVKLSGSAHTMTDLQKLVEKNRTPADPCRAVSWKYLAMYLRIAQGLIDVFAARAVDDRDKTRQAWEAVKQYVQEQEDEMSMVFDVFEFIQAVEFMNKSVLNLDESGTG